MSLNELWKSLGKCANQVDTLEKVVESVWERPAAKGREVMFFGEKKFRIPAWDTSPQESPLVHSAGSITRVTRLTYSVEQLVDDVLVGSLIWLPMRQNPRMMAGTSKNAFDFEWTYMVGSSQRKYSTSNPSPDGWNWLSRSALANFESRDSLLFNPKHPLVLETNEFLTFRIRPIYWGYPVDPSDPTSDMQPVRVVISYAGYRTSGY